MTSTRRLSTTPSPAPFYLILSSSLVLLILGFVMVLSATTVTSLSRTDSPYSDAVTHGMIAVVALVLAAIVAAMPVEWLRRLSLVAMLLTWAIASLRFFGFTLEAAGNEAWVLLPIIHRPVQPSEFMKLGMILYLAASLAPNVGQLTTWQRLAGPFVAAAGSVLFVMLGGDLGTALIFWLIIMAMLLRAGLPRWMLAVLLGATVIGVGYEIFDNPTRILRIMSFLPGVDVGDHADRLTYQPMHAEWAFGTGGLFGVGLGASREKWFYLPAADNDYILAIIGEELGLVGTTVVLILFAVLAIGIAQLYEQLSDPFSRLVTVGIGTWIIGQALVNILVALGLGPVVGVPLPFLSSGGSSLLSTIVAIGVLLSLARSEPGTRSSLSQSASAARRSMSVIASRVRRSP
ncbi:MAG: FtsW/RodA/SpoVE family cell cycle protein [Bowdeniella nasicola]|nr:FtsW/RodA/SpoVE family cell cycle protein [Bowdeniella nasicola]